MNEEPPSEKMELGKLQVKSFELPFMRTFADTSLVWRMTAAATISDLSEPGVNYDSRADFHNK